MKPSWRQHVRRTPLLKLGGAALGCSGVEVWLKLEHLQVSGSFKARGMFHHLLSAEVPAVGAVIASGGNAGIAAAYACQQLGYRCEVFVPTISSAAKQNRLKSLGAAVTVVGELYADAAAAAAARQRETGALAMHAYDVPEVIAGAATLGVEIEEAVGLPDRTLVSVGGGGLISGLVDWSAGRVRVEALEPELAPTFHQAIAAGQPLDVGVSGVAADALGARRIGSLAWTRRAHITGFQLLSDHSIRAARQWLWDELRLLVEPSAALGVAALRQGVVRPEPGERVALILCGANTTDWPD